LLTALLAAACLVWSAFGASAAQGEATATTTFTGSFTYVVPDGTVRLTVDLVGGGGGGGGAFKAGGGGGGAGGRTHVSLTVVPGTTCVGTVGEGGVGGPGGSPTGFAGTSGRPTRIDCGAGNVATALGGGGGSGGGATLGGSGAAGGPGGASGQRGEDASCPIFGPADPGEGGFGGGSGEGAGGRGGNGSCSGPGGAGQSGVRGVAVITSHAPDPYSFGGFLSPIDDPPTVNVGKAGRTYAVKFRVTDANGAYVIDLGAVSSLSYKAVSCGLFASDATDALEVTATGGTTLRYDIDSNQYVYNWDTPGQAGCYELFLTLADGGVQTANFQLK
jgi:hypothetical protein